MSASPPPHEFFVDRSLGRVAVARILRAEGWRLATLAEVYGDREETVDDDEWLERAGAEGWVVLTKDKRIRKRPAEIDAIRRHRVRAFVIASGQLTAAEQAGRFLANATRIAEAAAEPGPLVYAVHARRIERVYPRTGQAGA